jgi:hypothetical protein
MAVVVTTAAIDRACPTSMGIPTPAGNDKILGKTNPPAVPAGGFFWLSSRPLTRWLRLSIRFEG